MVIRNDKIEENQPDTHKEEQPSSDVNGKEKTREDETRDNDIKDDRESNTESFIPSYSSGSRLDFDNVNSEIAKGPIEKRGSRQQQKRKRRTYWRADKRRRPNTRRRDSERASKRLRRDTRDRDSSTSTIISKLSSKSRSRSPICKDCTVCKTCGHHHICRRRSVISRARLSNDKKNSLGRKTVNKESKAVQVGSRSAMLSPLFVTEGLAASPVNQNNNYVKITPDMIYQCVKSLTMWTHYVKTQRIYEHLKRYYPVNPDEEKLLEELQEKLEIASVTGLILQVDEDLWCLNCPLMNQEVFETHVSRFWDTYLDTLQPIDIDTRNPARKPRSNKSCEPSSSEEVI